LDPSITQRFTDRILVVDHESKMAPVVRRLGTAFLKRQPEFKLVPVTPGEGGAPSASLLSDGTLRILPHHVDGGLDGFFVARFERGLHPSAATG